MSYTVILDQVQARRNPQGLITIKRARTHQVVLLPQDPLTQKRNQTM